MDDPLTPWYVSLIIAWLPFMVLVGLAWWIARRLSNSLRTPDGKSVGEVVEFYGQELKRQNDLLERLLAERRKESL
jgi:hypothetical protein